MSLVIAAWKGISEKPLRYTTLLQYSGHFADYNGNIALQDGRITVKLSKKWKDISTDIQLGIIQDLLCRLFKIKAQTSEMDVYAAFLRNAHASVKKTQTDPILEASFVRINDKFFANMLEQPNLGWNQSKNRLGTYHYGSDKVSISVHLKDDLDLLDYVMYHELLHKWHKFQTKNGKNRYHNRAFRLDEQKYPDAARLDRRLNDRLRLIR